MITIVDYKLGNVRSVANALKYLKNTSVKLSSSPKDIQKADGIILPGVGAFRKAMNNLEYLGLIEPVKAFIESGKPYLGICLGLQLLFTKSKEHGSTSGFNIIDGEVEEFSKEVKKPHIGWNQVESNRLNHMFNGIEDSSFFYFDHSYYVVPNSNNHLRTGKTEYGRKFVSALIRDNIWGVQFHPEKSADKGLKLLENFIEKC
ncbi:MAG: imidazole glycerol phosphate synthase subunit HisH [Elusimicrobiota bacterium]